jgi:transcriptional regulator with XRE-family HTH domain
MDITEEIGNRIRYYRKDRKLSQEELAEISGLHSSYIGQLERGIKSPSVDTIYKITKGLDVTMADFLRNIEMFDTDEDTYAMKSYLLIEQENESDQKHLYEIIKNIVAFKAK